MRSILRVFSALALIVALTVITGPSASAASARGTETQNRDGGKGSGDVVLTYTKWFAPAYPTMQGIVGGDIEGTFGGAVLSRTVLPTVVLLEARYEIIANKPSHSFTALIAGSLKMLGPKSASSPLPRRGLVWVMAGFLFRIESLAGILTWRCGEGNGASRRRAFYVELQRGPNGLAWPAAGMGLEPQFELAGNKP